MKKNTVTTVTLILSKDSILALARSQDPEWAKVADGFELRNVSSDVQVGPGLTLTFRRTEDTDTAVVSAVPEARWLPNFYQTYSAGQELLERASFVAMPPEDRIRVVDELLQDWHDAGEEQTVTAFAATWYRNSRYFKNAYPGA